MADEQQAVGKYPMLEAVLAAKGLPLKGIYTVADAAEIFGVSRRTIHEWIKDEKFVARHLPGRGRFLSQDLEDSLQNSQKRSLKRRGAKR